MSTIREFDMRTIKTNPSFGHCSLVVGKSSVEKTSVLRHILNKFASDHSIYETYTITDEREAFSRPSVYNTSLDIETTEGVPSTHMIKNSDVEKIFDDIYKKQRKRMVIMNRQCELDIKNRQCEKLSHTGSCCQIPGVLIVVRTRTPLLYMSHKLFMSGPRHLNTSFLVVHRKIQDIHKFSIQYYDHVFLVQGKKSLDSFYKRAIGLLELGSDKHIKKFFRRNACVVYDPHVPTTNDIDKLWKYGRKCESDSLDNLYQLKI